MPPLATRNLQPELMDHPALDQAEHRRALCGLRRLNWWSNSVGILWKEVRRFAFQNQLRSLRVLDVACGGGDVTIGLARKSTESRVELDVCGVDISATAIDTARQAAKGMSNVHFQRGDVLADPLPGGFDVIVCSLFLHHLTESQAIELLMRMNHAGPRLVLVNDLRRSLAGYWLAQCACRAFTRSRIVHTDGPRSVASAFTIAEMMSLCDQAGMKSASVVPKWPFRLLVRAT